MDDVLAALKYLESRSNIDPSRIYLGGHSTGGTLVLLVAAATNRFKGIVSLGPVENPTGYGQEYFPVNANDPKEIQLRAPINWLELIQTPTLVIEGSQGNASSIQALDAKTNNPALQFVILRDRNHFNIIAPVNELLADKILGNNPNGLKMTDAEIRSLQGVAKRMPSRDDFVIHVTEHAKEFLVNAMVGDISKHVRVSITGSPNNPELEFHIDPHFDPTTQYLCTTKDLKIIVPIVNAPALHNATIDLVRIEDDYGLTVIPAE